MERTQKLRSFINLDLPGLEIGPSFRRFARSWRASRSMLSTTSARKGLRQKYTGHGVNLDAIEHVDFVWNGDKTYGQFTGKTYGWIIASHVMEHTPDLVSFLQGCEEVLSPDGVLALAIPDKRYCFHHFRPYSSLASVLDAFEQKRNRRASEQSSGSWSRSKKLEFIHNDVELRSAVAGAKSGAFLVAHSWCFTPSSFRLMIEDLNSLELMAPRVRILHHERKRIFSRPQQGRKWPEEVQA